MFTIRSCPHKNCGNNQSIGQCTTEVHKGYECTRHKDRRKRMMRVHHKPCCSTGILGIGQRKRKSTSTVKKQMSKKRVTKIIASSQTKCKSVTYSKNDNGEKVINTVERIDKRQEEHTNILKMFMEWKTVCERLNTKTTMQLNNLKNIISDFEYGYQKLKDEQQGYYREIELTEDLLHKTLHENKECKRMQLHKDITYSDFDHNYKSIRNTIIRLKNEIYILNDKASKVPKKKDDYLLGNGVQSQRQFIDDKKDRMLEIRRMRVKQIPKLEFSRTDPDTWDLNNVIDCYMVSFEEMIIDVKWDAKGKNGGTIYFKLPCNERVYELYMDLSENELMEQSHPDDSVLFENSLNYRNNMSISTLEDMFLSQNKHDMNSLEYKPEETIIE